MRVPVYNFPEGYTVHKSRKEIGYMEQKQRVRHRDEAVEPIECYLRTNDIPPHGKLPAEREMCEMWGLNRTTLRAAIRRLTETGSL